MKNSDRNVIAFQAPRSFSSKNRIVVPTLIVGELDAVPGAQFDAIVSKADQGQISVRSQSQLGRRHPGCVAHQQQPVEAAGSFTIRCDSLQFQFPRAVYFALRLMRKLVMPSMPARKEYFSSYSRQPGFASNIFMLIIDMCKLQKVKESWLQNPRNI